MTTRVKSIVRFVRTYPKFCAAALASLLGLAFQLAGWAAATHWVIGVTTGLLAIPILVDIVRDLRSGIYGVDVLALTAIVTALIMGEFWAGMVIVLMLTGGEALEDFAENRAKRELTALLHHAPQRAHVLHGAKEVEVPAREVRKDDKIIIRPGEVVPVDAVILEGVSSVDEASITGESLPEQKTAGNELLSGAINLDGVLTARALRPASESQYEQIIKFVKQATASRAPFVRFADRFAIPFTAISFAIAGAAWALSGDSLRFLQVMVVATPCPLILAAPIAIISGMSRSSKAGVIVKNGTALERLAEARSFAFDKTGTLTHGKLTVKAVKAYAGYSAEQVVAAAAALERGSNHIVGKAILRYAEDQDIKVPRIKHVREESGQGLLGSIDHKEVLVGRLSFVTEQGARVPANVTGQASKQTSTYVAISGELAGYISFADEVRDESAATIRELKERGIEDIYLITGDNEVTAHEVAKQMGIPEKNVVANALPVDKFRTVERVAKAPVVFVGDGVNDAPVLVAADVGMALGAKGSTAASESADVVIMKDDFSRVAVVHEIAQRTFKIARQSVLVGIGLSVALMLVFATGKFAPVIGAATQELVDVVVIFNALRAHFPARRRS